MSTAVQNAKPAVAKRLEGKVVVVTGGSRGIGASIALRLASEGATVAVNYAKNKQAADKVVAEIVEKGGKAAAFGANVTVAEDNKKMFAEIKKTFGHIDILVNNAGVFELSPLESITLEHYDRVFDVNVKGVIAATIAAIPHIKDGGRIINISSVAATSSMAGGSIYSATKAALNTFTRVWAQELGARQITVNGIAPGATVTDMYEQGVSKEMGEMFVSRTALKRLGQPDDIAAAAAFLASEDGRWVTGQTIVADGGFN